ncbi:MAG: EF-hand domain-containing protein [Verrucomicrobia bacterium]|nr:EF-hand domain-containing protein [Verrucomicrobiota bacterium]
MKTFPWILFASALALALGAANFARAADSTSSSTTQNHKSGRGGHGLGPLGLFDTNHDGVLSSDEIDNAAAVLRQLDKNGDGKITADEAPHGPPPPPRSKNSGGDDDMPPPPPPAE